MQKEQTFAFSLIAPNSGDPIDKENVLQLTKTMESVETDHVIRPKGEGSHRSARTGRSGRPGEKGKSKK